MNTFLLIVLIITLLIGFIAILARSSRRNLELRKARWFEEEGNCQIGEVPGSRFEGWYYKGAGREIYVIVTGADGRNGVRIFMDGFRDGFEENSRTLPIEDNKIAAARILKYFGLVMGRNTLKLHHEGFPRPSEELVKEIEDKIKPIGYARVLQDENKEITWITK